MKRLVLIVCILLTFVSAAWAEEAPAALKYGDKSDAVLEMQTTLKEKLYYNGPLSGEFGSLTRSAVQRVQEAYGLPVTGVADGDTLAVIAGDCYRVLKYDMSGKDVSLLQEALTLYGYYQDKISGNYLRNTRAGVAAFQAANGLESTGIADVKTQELL